uniref:Ovule protein n=1 Tax=Panagrellus redivivus TaxID=6233 RepID=A0A7E4VRU9_PANRE
MHAALALTSLHFHSHQILKYPEFDRSKAIIRHSAALLIVNLMKLQRRSLPLTTTHIRETPSCMLQSASSVRTVIARTSSILTEFYAASRLASVNSMRPPFHSLE